MIAPLVLLVGLVLVRGGGRRAVRGALLIAGALTTVALPVLLRLGKTANASVLPLDYPRNWLIAMVAVATVASCIPLESRPPPRSPAFSTRHSRSGPDA